MNYESWNGLIRFRARQYLLPVSFEACNLDFSISTFLSCDIVAGHCLAHSTSSTDYDTSRQPFREDGFYRMTKTGMKMLGLVTF